MDKITAYIAEDEPRARQLLRRLVLADIRLFLIGSAADGKNAAHDIQRLRPDLLFLDINMPLLSGIELVRQLQYSPLVVFTTAYDEHAVTAFELQALDYLLKPFGPRRFEKSVTRAVSVIKERLAGLSRGPSAAQGAAAASTTPAVPKKSLDRIFVRDKNLRIPVDLKDILAVEACDDYVQIHTAAKSYLMPLRMNILEAEFEPTGFVRVHRSWIVNLALIQSIENHRDGRITITMKNDQLIRTSRAGGRRLKEVMAH